MCLQLTLEKMLTSEMYVLLCPQSRQGQLQTPCNDSELGEM